MKIRINVQIYDDDCQTACNLRSGLLHMSLLFRKNNLFLEAISCLYVVLQVVMQTEDVRPGAVHISDSHAAC